MGDDTARSSHRSFLIPLFIPPIASFRVNFQSEIESVATSNTDTQISVASLFEVGVFL